MRKLLISLFLLFLAPVASYSQANAPIGQTVSFVAGTSTGNVIDATTNAAGVTQWVFTWVDVGTISAGTVKLQQSVDSVFTSPTDCIVNQTVTSSGGPTAFTSCTAPYFRLLATGITGAGTVTVRLLGFASPSPSSGSTTVSQPTPSLLNATVTEGPIGAVPWPVTLSNGSLVTDYSGTGMTVTTLALSSGTTVMTVSTVDVQQIRCNNFTASTVFITMTDTAGNLFTGEATAKLGFAIPAYGEDYPIPAGSHVRMVGIKMYAGTGSAVNCTIFGKQ